MGQVKVIGGQDPAFDTFSDFVNKFCIKFMSRFQRPYLYTNSKCRDKT